MLNLQPDSETHIHWKGAAEIVLAKCTRYIDTSGCWVAINEEKVRKMVMFLKLIAFPIEVNCI